MDQKSTAERVIGVVAEQLGIEVSDVKLESNIIDDLGADSLDHIEIAMAIEDVFSVEISDEEIEKIKTVSELADIVTQKGGK